MSERVLVKVSATTPEQAKYVAEKVISQFGENNVLMNFPRKDERTGFWYIFLNILNVPMNPAREEGR